MSSGRRNLIYLILFLLVSSQSFNIGFSQSTIFSNGSGGGDWSDPNTWAGMVVPAATDTAVIVTGDTILVSAVSGEISVGGLTIQNGGLVWNSNRRINIYGNYLNDGVHRTDGGDLIYWRGINTLIDGTGNINNAGRIRVLSGDKIIPASATLTFGNGNFRIEGNLVVTNYGNVNFPGRITSANANSTWINEANASVEAGYDIVAGGILVASATNNTVRYSRPASQNIKPTSDGSYFHLELAGSISKNLIAPVTVLGNLTVTCPLNTNENDIVLLGSFTNTSLLNGDSSIISLTGTGNQTITNPAGEEFYSLTLNKTSGSLVLSDNLVVTDTLRMLGGNIQCGTSMLTLGTDAAGPDALIHTDGIIVGSFKRWIRDTGSDILMPAGTAGVYRPVILNFTNLTPGTLTAEFVGTNPGTNGLPLIDGTDTISNVYTEGYWNVASGDGLQSSDYDLRIAGTGFSSFPVDTATRILKRPSAGSSWILDGSHLNADGDTAYRVGLSGFSQFGFGSPDSCDAPQTGAIVGWASVCINDAGQSYSVTNTPGSSYNWTVDGGTVSGGQGTNAITIDWGGTGQTGWVEVIETNACADGVPVRLDVDIHPLPVSGISGPASIPANATGISYTVENRIGYTYAWIVTGGTLVSGDGTNEIFVDWGGEGAGNVQVTATHTACGSSAAPENLPVNIYGSVRSVQTGDWNDPLTWDCNCIPASTDNIVISPGDSVSLVAHTTVQSFTIEENGVFYHPDPLNLIVQGDYRVDGDHAGNGGGDF